MGKKIFLGIIIGLLILAVIFCITVLIGCSINKLGFVEQIKDWFGKAAEVAEEAETAARIRF